MTKKKKCLTSIFKNFIIVLLGFTVTAMTLWAENPSILLNGNFENYSTLKVDVFSGLQLSAEIVNGGVSIPPSGDAVSSMGTEYFELDARAFTCLPTNWSPLRSKPLGTIISVR